jgi:hypothetical protein
MTIVIVGFHGWMHTTTFHGYRLKVNNKRLNYCNIGLTQKLTNKYYIKFKAYNNCSDN